MTPEERDRVGDPTDCSVCHGPCTDPCQHVELRATRRPAGTSATEHTGGVLVRYGTARVAEARIALSEGRASAAQQRIAAALLDALLEEGL